jgi:hypothetical protein
MGGLTRIPPTERLVVTAQSVVPLARRGPRNVVDSSLASPSSRRSATDRAKQTEVCRHARSGTPTAVEVERRRTHGSDGFTDVTGDVDEVLQYECRFADVTGDVGRVRKVTSAVVQIALPAIHNRELRRTAPRRGKAL